MKAWPRSQNGRRSERQQAMSSILRFVIIACLAAIGIIAVGEALRTEVADRATAPMPAVKVPLAADLARCRDITAEQLAADDTCRRVWAETRRRFLAPAKSGEAR